MIMDPVNLELNWEQNLPLFWMLETFHRDPEEVQGYKVGSYRAGPKKAPETEFIRMTSSDYEPFVIKLGLWGQTPTRLFLMWTPPTVFIRFPFLFPSSWSFGSFGGSSPSQGQGPSRTWSGTSDVPLRPLLLFHSILWTMWLNLVEPSLKPAPWIWIKSVLPSTQSRRY